MTSQAAVGPAHAERLLAVVPDPPAAGVDRISVVVIDTDEATAEVLRAHLPGADARVLFASTIEEARAVLASDRYAADVRAEIREAAALGCTGVPFFVIDRRYGISGAQPAELFAQVLERVALDTGTVRSA